MEAGENHKSPRFCISRGQKLAVIRLHRGATLQSAVEAIVAFHCKTMCFIKLFGDVNMFSIVLSENDPFLNISQVFFIH